MPAPDPEAEREALTSDLDRLLDRLKALLGPSGMAALVAGRVARLAHLNLTRPTT